MIRPTSRLLGGKLETSLALFTVRTGKYLHRISTPAVSLQGPTWLNVIMRYFSPEFSRFVLKSRI